MATKTAKTLPELFERLKMPMTWAATPMPALTLGTSDGLVVTNGLARRTRSMWRGLEVGLELVGDPSALDALVAAAIADLRDREPHVRYVNLPPRGIMVNGAFEGAREPHLVFIADGLPRGLQARVRVGGGYVEFLRAIPITRTELADYDKDPGGFANALPR